MVAASGTGAIVHLFERSEVKCGCIRRARCRTKWGMPQLTRPTTAVHRSFLAGMAEFAAEGRGAPEDRTMIGEEIRSYRSSWARPEGFADYVAWLRGQAEESAPRPEGFVPSTTYWWTDGPEYLGRLAIRHRLTPALLE